ncbi:MAG: hypothetical protein AABZ06_14715 [Bdellovibrionota bacterium]
MRSKISPDWPVWYNPLSPIGSATRYVMGLSPWFEWVGIYTIRRSGLKFRLAADIGSSQRGIKRNSVVVPINDKNGSPLGKICINSDPFIRKTKDQSLNEVNKVARELRDLWPE